MMTFLRLLRSLSTNVPLVVLLTNTLTSSTAPSNGLSVFPSPKAQEMKPSLGPTFSYLADWTICISAAEEAFPAEKHPEGTRIMEVWRSRRTASRISYCIDIEMMLRLVSSLIKGGWRSQWMGSSTSSFTV